MDYIMDNLENRLQSLLYGAKAILKFRDFEKSAKAIFDICRDLIGAQSGYVALLSHDGSENEVLFLESGGLPCTVNPNLPMPIRGLRAKAYEMGKAVYENDFSKSDWMKYMPKGHVELNNVLFSPLLIDGKAVGLIGLANKSSNFNEDDAELATAFGEFAAIALNNSKMLEEINKHQENLKQKINELEKFKKITTDRELKMIELKKEIDKLLIKNREKPRYFKK